VSATSTRPDRTDSPQTGLGPGKENTTITPIPGDLCYFAFDSEDLANPAYGYEADEEHTGVNRVVDLALFYGRNSLLINGDQGWCRATCSGRWSRGSRRWRPPVRTCGWAVRAARP